MASRPRIRWENVAKLGAGGAACVALVAALPGLLRRPEPPPLETDVGFASATSGPAPAQDDHARHRRHGPRDTGHDKRNRRDSPHEPRRRHPLSKAGKRKRTDSPGPSSPPPTPARSAATVEVAPAPTTFPVPVAPPKPTAPPPPPAPSEPDPPEPPPHPSEFGFER